MFYTKERIGNSDWSKYIKMKRKGLKSCAEICDFRGLYTQYSTILKPSLYFYFPTQKKNRHLQPIRRMIYEATLLREEEAPAIEDQNVENQKNKNTLWKNAGMFAGKFTAMHVKK